MALILRGQSTCSICSNDLNEGDEIVATTHFIADPTDPLWRFSDSGMHKSCFLEWEHRQEFIRKFNNTRGTMTFGNGNYYHMEEAGSISALKRIT